MNPLFTLIGIEAPILAFNIFVAMVVILCYGAWLLAVGLYEPVGKVIDILFYPIIWVVAVICAAAWYLATYISKTDKNTENEFTDNREEK